MALIKAREKKALSENEFIGKLLILPGLLYDASYLLLRFLIFYTAPMAFLAIIVFMLFGVWLHIGKDTTAVSNAIIAMLVGLSALGFSWAEAESPEGRDYLWLMAASKQLMHSTISLILATGFKFTLRSIPPEGFLPFDGALLRTFLWLIMAALFAQAMLVATLPILKFHIMLFKSATYLPGLSLMRTHLPNAHGRVADWLQKHRGGQEGKSQGASA